MAFSFGSGYNANRAGLHQLQGGDIDLGELGRISRNRGAGKQARRDSLGIGFYGFGQINGSQHALAAEELAQAGAERGPVRFGQVEMAPQVEQGDLADAAAFAPGFDQAVTVIGLAGGGAAGGDFWEGRLLKMG